MIALAVGFTGTQKGMTVKQQQSLMNWLQKLKPGEFHHGQCIGADKEADTIACCLNIKRVLHPPTDTKKKAACPAAEETRPAKPYLNRNFDIVMETDTLIAAPKSLREELRSGTWATIRAAKRYGKKVIILEP